MRSVPSAASSKMKLRLVPAYVNRPLMLYHFDLIGKQMDSPVSSAAVIWLIPTKRRKPGIVRRIISRMLAGSVACIIAEELPTPLRKKA